MGRQQRNILRAFAQRHRGDRKHVQSKIEVLAESPGRHLVAECPVGRRNDAHVDVQRPIATDALELPLLQDTQEFALQLQGYLADLVEKQRAAIGKLEATDTVTMRTCKSAFDMAKELAFEQLLRDRGAVDLDERTIGALAPAVYFPRDQFLADAGLADACGSAPGVVCEFVYDLTDSSVISVYEGDESLANVKLSPDGSQVGFVLKNDIYTLELASGNTCRWTLDGSENIINGAFDAYDPLTAAGRQK